MNAPLHLPGLRSVLIEDLKRPEQPVPSAKALFCARDHVQIVRLDVAAQPLALGRFHEGNRPDARSPRHIIAVHGGRRAHLDAQQLAVLNGLDQPCALRGNRLAIHAMNLQLRPAAPCGWTFENAPRYHAPVVGKQPAAGLGSLNRSGDEPLCTLHCGFFHALVRPVYGRAGREGRKALPVLRRSANPSGSAHPLGRGSADSLNESEHITMATPTPSAPAQISAVLAELTHDIIISLHSVAGFAWTEFQGTRAQLEAEGLIPPDLRWPGEGFDCVEWQAGKVRYRLCRRRPDCAKGPRKAFAGIDWWSVRSELLDPRPWNERILADKVAEFRKSVYALSAEGLAARSQLFNAYCEAKRDAGFQAFLSRVPGLVKPARRRASKTEGGRHD